MDLLQQYGDGDEESEQAPSSQPSKPTARVSSRTLVSVSVNAAPEVDLHLHAREAASGYVDPTVKSIRHNPTADQLWQPVAGPSNPNRNAAVPKNSLTGFVQAESYDEAAFHDHYYAFETKGVTHNPSLLDSSPLLERKFEQNISAKEAGKQTAVAAAAAALALRKAAAAGGSGLGADANAGGDALNPSSTELLALSEAVAQEGRAAHDLVAKTKRKRGGEAGDVQGFLGSWGPLEGETRIQSELTDEQKK